MTGVAELANARQRVPGAADLWCAGLGATAAMWACGYVLRLPSLQAPAPILFASLVLILAGSGFWIGGRTRRSVSGAALTGLISGVSNLLILGGVLGDRLHREAALWIPGFLAFCCLVAVLGFGLRRALGPPAPDRPEDWPGRLVMATAGATAVLLAVGGLVTSHDAGLAVVDWPNTFGHNMFLFPFSRMSGGIYYEHAHRLYGALVGLMTVITAAVLQRAEPRRSIRAAAWTAVALVVLQGILGGLRVTGRFTLSQDPAHVAPSLTLAVIHGVVGQLFFAWTVALAAAMSAAWRRPPEGPAPPAARTDRWLASVFAASVVIQLVLGAMQRHLSQGLLIHIVMALVVLHLGVALGARAWALYPPPTPVLYRGGRWLLALLAVQVALGILAMFATGGLDRVGAPWRVQPFVTTAHQWCGAWILGLGVVMACWAWRLGGREPGRRRSASAEGAAG